MSTPGNDSAGRHRDETGPAPLFDPATARSDAPPASSDGAAPSGTLTADRSVAERTSGAAHAAADKTADTAHAAADKASGAAHSAADKASVAARSAADKLASVRSTIAAKKESKPAPARTEEASIGDLVKDASTHMSTLVRSEIELAKTELTATVKKAAIGGALFVVAAVIIIYSLTFGLIAAAEGIHAGGFPRWASYLIVWGALLLLAGLAALVGILLVKRMKKPERTLSTVKDTAAWAKSRGKSD